MLGQWRAVVCVLLGAVIPATSVGQAPPGAPGAPGTPGAPLSPAADAHLRVMSEGKKLTPSALVAQIKVSPDSQTVPAGGCAQFSAAAYDPGGKPVALAQFTYSVSNATAFQADASGAICAQRNLPQGARTTVTAGAPGVSVSGTATLVALPGQPVSKPIQVDKRAIANPSRTLQLQPVLPNATDTTRVKGFAGTSPSPFVAQLTWQGFGNATGYMLWRDGQLVTTPQPLGNVTTFADRGVSPGSHGYGIAVLFTKPDGSQGMTTPGSLATILVNVSGLPARAQAWLQRPSGPGSLSQSTAYYMTLGAMPTKDTFAKWKTANMFDYAPANHAELRAVYFNAGDLMFGRDMHCVEQARTNDGLIVLYPRANNEIPYDETIIGASCWVANHGPQPGTSGFPNPTVAIGNAIDQVHPFATVAMEWKINGGVQFYAYGADGHLVTSAALDSEGPKFVPNACLSCHGGALNTSTNLVEGAAFLPFDVTSFQYSTTNPGFSYAAQQYVFAKLNALVANTRQGSDQITDFIAGLGQSGAAYVPASWSAKPDLYQNIVRPYCRTCHLAVRPDVIQSSQNFTALAGRIQQLACTLHTMPHAEVPFRKLWTSSQPYAPAYLASTLNITCGS